MDPAVLELQTFVDSHLGGRRGLRVLEAGCGSASYLRMPPDTWVVGIDISAKQLERNPLLCERIRSDIQHCELIPASFDMIVCWDVLEHLQHPEWALERFLGAIRNSGIIVLALPNVMSLKGQITKWTPHGFHVWVYRRIFGRKEAGTEDYGPFKTYMKQSVSPKALRRFAAERGFVVEFARLYEANTQQTVRAKLGLVDRRWRYFKALTRLLSLGRMDPEGTDCILVLRRGFPTPGQADADTGG